MSSVALFLFGPPQMQMDGQTIHLRKHKAEALLAYLAITRTLHSRDMLAALLWPDLDQQHARMYLRQQLYHLRRALGAEHFVVTQETLGLAQLGTLTTDVEHFRHHLATAHEHQLTQSIPDMLSALTEAATAYRDDFMAGFSVADAPGFEEWQRYERESLRRALIDALRALVDGHQRIGKVEQALAYARRWASLEPLQEAAHRSLMQLYAKHGDQAGALAQYEQCATLLAEELDAPPAAATTTLYAQIKAGTVPNNDHKRERLTPQSASSHLPHQPTPFVGRTAELAQIARDLANPACRLLTLLGPGGIGKSRLAIEVARAATDHFAHGAHFVPLAALADATEIDSAILQALEIPQQSTLPARQLLLKALRNKEMLLVLDNYEQLLPKTDTIAALLEEAPQLKLLVTTRERLNLSAEWVLPLAGLNVPTTTLVPTETITDAIIELSTHSAVQLFVQTAQRTQPAFALTATNGAAVAELCRLVDGNPLAVKLAAGWIKMMPPALILHSAQREFGILRTEMQDVPPRHRSMTTVFETSWRLLCAAERNTLRQLGVFVGTFAVAAAQGITGTNLGQLATLVDKSWIATTTEGRMQLHELVRQFVLEKLTAEHQLVTGEAADAVHGRHSQWYGGLLQQLEPLLKGEDQVTALQQIQTDRANIWKAWQWAVDHGALSFFQQAGFALWYAADTLGWLPEAIDAYDAAIDALRVKRDDLERNAESSSECALTLAALLIYQAILYPRAGQLAQAQQKCTEACSYLQRLPATPQQQMGIALAKLAHGWVLHDLADEEGAVTAMSCAHTILKEQQNHWWLGQAELLMGLAVHSLGHHEEAKTHFVAAAQLWQTLGEQRFRCFALGRLAEVAREAGDLVSAQSYLSEVYQLRHLLGDRVGLGYALVFLGDTALAQADHIGAECWYREAQQLAQELGNHHVLLDVHLGLGQLALAQGALTEADHSFSAAYRLALEAQRPQQMIMALLGRSDVAIAQGRAQQSYTFIDEALRSATQLERESLQLEVLVHYAKVAHHRDESAEAIRLLTLICQHPATTGLLRTEATQLLERMAETEAALPISEVSTTSDRLQEAVTILLTDGTTIRA